MGSPAIAVRVLSCAAVIAMFAATGYAVAREVFAANDNLDEPIQSAADPAVVPFVDLERYQGTWYEIARLPNGFQENCSGEVTANYTLRDDGKIDVVNTCARDGDSPQRATGVARVANRDGPDSKLEVRFAPGFLSWLPVVWGDYWIFELAPDYGHALVGSPDGSYLWILSRTPQLDVAAWDSLRDAMVERGFEAARLIITRQRH